MKLIIFTILFSIITTSCIAQRAAEFHCVEVEFNGGYSKCADMVIGGTPNAFDSHTYSAEVRYNFQKIPFDLGVRGYTTTLPDMYDNIRGWGVDLVVDYNMLFTSKNIVPFIGIGGGKLFCDDSFYHPQSEWHLMPRVGIELYQHFRVTLGFDMYDFIDNYATLSIGVAFGGGRRQ